MNNQNYNSYDEIKDNEIRIIGSGSNILLSDHHNNNGHRKQDNYPKGWVYFILGIITILLIWGLYSFFSTNESEEEVVLGMDETISEVIEKKTESKSLFGMAVDSQEKGFTEMRDTVINDIQLRLFIPHNADMTLSVGTPDKTDKDIVFIAQAADIRRDNKKIVGAYVLKGELLSRGQAKAGFCAIINNHINIGVAPNTSLLEEAIEQNGYFFRQFPLVSEGNLVENEQRGKSIRRSICDRNGEIFMTETLSPESFHDFSQALVDLGVDNAIYLVGSVAYGWAIDQEGNQIEFGQEGRYISPYINYIVWKRK